LKGKVPVEITPFPVDTHQEKLVPVAVSEDMIIASLACKITALMVEDDGFHIPRIGVAVAPRVAVEYVAAAVVNGVPTPLEYMLPL
jgi:hypothetical protein